MNFLDKLKHLKTMTGQKAGVDIGELLRQILAEAQKDMPTIVANATQIMDAVDALIALFQPCPDPVPEPA